MQKKSMLISIVLTVLILSGFGIFCSEALSLNNDQMSEDIQEVVSTIPGSKIIDLGEKGLEPGDEIDSYLKEWLQDDHQVHIPEGTYKLNSQLSFVDTFGNTSIVGQGEVILDRGDLHESVFLFKPTDDFAIHNITLAGKGAAHHFGGGINLYTTNPDATLVLYNVKMNDGAVKGDSGGIFVFRYHTGKIYFIDVEVAGFADNGLYASAPGMDGLGEVHVYGGKYKNNNISNIRIGSPNSSIRKAVSIHDDLAPLGVKHGNARNQRGIWVFGEGTDMLIEDVDLIQTIGWNPIVLSKGSGTVENIRIYTESSADAISVDAGTDWGGSSINLTGSGNYSLSGSHSFTDIKEGDEAQEPPQAP